MNEKKVIIVFTICRLPHCDQGISITSVGGLHMGILLLLDLRPLSSYWSQSDYVNRCFFDLLRSRNTYLPYLEKIFAPRMLKSASTIKLYYDAEKAYLLDP